MDLSQLASVLVTLTAACAYLGVRYTKLPTTIAVMIISLSFSAVLVLLHAAGWSAAQPAIDLVAQIDFDETVFHGMLSFLLFASALQLDRADLLKNRLSISLLATVGVIIAWLLVAAGLYGLVRAVGLDLPLVYCFVFGALIAPTDAVAIMALMRASMQSSAVRANIVGESLFNDGMAVVLFTLIASTITSDGGSLAAAEVATFIFRELFGGILVGVGLGWIAYAMIKSIDNYRVEVLLTIAVASGGYAFADWLAVSGPVAMATAGVFIGHYARHFGMSARNREQLDNFWELVDEILNAVLFVLIGLELTLLSYTIELLWVTLACIPLVLASRWVSVAVPLAVLPSPVKLGRHGSLLLTWGGLRGAISVAMALSLPESVAREVIVSITYGVVLFSVLIQGPTMPALARWFGGQSTRRPERA